MTVRELIKKLNKVKDKEIQVVLMGGICENDFGYFSINDALNRRCWKHDEDLFFIECIDFDIFDSVPTIKRQKEMFYNKNRELKEAIKLKKQQETGRSPAQIARQKYIEESKNAWKQNSSLEEEDEE